MARLTKRTKEGYPYLANVKDDEQEVDCKSRNTAQCIMDSWERLAAYEDLGTVEELAELVKAKEKRSIGCEYCNGNTFDSVGAKFMFGYPKVFLNNGGGLNDDERFKFCPMCGRPLKEGNDERD